MINLLLSILASVGIFLTFRLFKVYNVNVRHGIMVNYLIAGATGLLVFQPTALWIADPWFVPACALGVLFYLVFRIMAKVTNENGMSISSVATKMSVLLPVGVGIILLEESLTFLKAIGVLLGLTAVLFSATGKGQGQVNAWLWPLLLFLGSGAIDSILKLFQYYWVSEDAFPIFISTIFLAAFLSALIHHSFSSVRSLRVNALAGGMVLGLVNFASLYFLLKTLAQPNWESSLVFPINNFGIIAGSTMLAIVFFNERLTKKAKAGLFLALLSIILLYFSQSS
jgi:uncharacterized membrane protein